MNRHISKTSTHSPYHGYRSVNYKILDEIALNCYYYPFSQSINKYQTACFIDTKLPR